METSQAPHTEEPGATPDTGLDHIRLPVDPITIGTESITRPRQCRHYNYAAEDDAVDDGGVE